MLTPAIVEYSLLKGHYNRFETGLYYLQSRYYDPEVCRFINADSYATTGQGFLGHNMFAYCLNSPACMVDTDGRDAILVVDYGDEGLPIVGHAYAYVQDENGTWYMTEWRGRFPDKSTAMIVCYEANDAQLKEIQQIMEGKSIEDKNYVYISGDFSESVDYAETWNGTNYGGYDLFDRNCMHYVRDTLLQGSFDHRLELIVLILTSYCSPVPKDLYMALVKTQMTSEFWKVLKSAKKKA